MAQYAGIHLDEIALVRAAGESGYDERWAFTDLRGQEYPTGRLVGDHIKDAWVAGLVIAHQRHKMARTGRSFSSSWTKTVR